MMLVLLCPVVAISDEKVTVSFNNADMLDVIRWASDLTDKNIIVSESVKNKKVTVISGDPMSKKEAYETFLSILQVSGLAVVEAEGSLKIFPAQEAKSNAIPLIDDGKASEEDIIIRIVKIKNIAAQQLLALLRPLVPATAAFEVHVDTNILLIADNKANIEKIVGLVEKIDKAGTIDIEVIALKHASAKDVVTLVSSLVPKIVGTGKDAATTQAINFAADERSNSILMSGDPVMRTQIKNLIERIDQPLEGTGNTQVVYLNYVDAKDMAEMLEKISGAVITKDKDQKATVTKDGEASIVASEANNALIITAPPALLNTMRDVIAKLDVRREQVLVEALLVEVSEEVGRQLGAMWLSSPRGTGTQVSGTFGTDGIKITPAVPAVGTSETVTETTAGVTTTTVTETITSPAIPASVSGPGGLLASYFRAGNLRGVLSAIETMSESNVLSTPTIIALDNEEAEILVGENVPFITGETSDVSSTETSRVSIERQDIGIHLKVKPRINLNNTITLEIEQKVESINETTKAGAADIITNKRELKTKAIVNDNEILVLGGLIRDESQDTETKVPFLGDIPVLGWLFKGTKKTMVKKNLMVFIHPKILRNSEENRDVSVGRYQDMRGLQEFYNKNSDFLTIRKSHPILKDLPSSMLNPESLSAKESLSADVITIKKDELSVDHEAAAPVVNSATLPVEEIVEKPVVEKKAATQKPIRKPPAKPPATVEPVAPVQPQAPTNAAVNATVEEKAADQPSSILPVPAPLPSTAIPATAPVVQ